LTCNTRRRGPDVIEIEEPVLIALWPGSRGWASEPPFERLLGLLGELWVCMWFLGLGRYDLEGKNTTFVGCTRRQIRSI
jgi:hypothetical protein